MIGKTISHYKITAELGAGGMGVVYEAVDTKLDRTVALKFLPPESTRDPNAKARFVHEAKAASALDHPNVCTIYEVGETDDGQLFLAMARYEGETLKERMDRGPLPLDDAMDITRQVATGLTKAHERDIVHRDIKPANIFITEDGLVKILDFGLAKLAGQTLLTKTGTTLGTAGYMSPEQARGDETDHRTDLWCLGVVLYEMVSGQRPFKGYHEQAIVYAILNLDPEPVTGLRTGVPLELERVIGKCLAKDPRERYQHADDLLADLRHLQRETNQGPTATRPPGVSRSNGGRRWPLVLAIIAVVVAGGLAGYLRLKDSPQSSQPLGDIETFVIVVAPFWGQNADALEEGKVMQALVERRLTEELGADETVRVLGKKNAVEAPRSNEDAKALGDKLGATIVIWGEVLVLREEVEIQPYVTLVKWFNGAENWSTESMQTSLEGPNQLSLRKTKAADVGQVALYVAGTFFAKKDPDKSLLLFQKIVPPTPGSLMRQGFILLDRGEWSESQKLFQRAIDLAPNEARPYWSMAGVYVRQLDYDEAIGWYQKAIDVDPTYQPAHGSVGDCLMRLGKYDEATRWNEKTLALFPGSFHTICNMAMIDFIQERYDAARVWAQKAIAVARNPHEFSTVYVLMGAICGKQEQYDEGQRWYEKGLEYDPENWMIYINIGNMNLQKQTYEEAIKWFERLARLAPSRVTYGLPFSYMILGRYREAAETFSWMMEIDPGDHNSSLLYIICLCHMGEKEKAAQHAAVQANALDDDTWLAPVIRFYAGEVTEGEVIRRTVADDPKKDNEQKCEAYYYLGVAHLLGFPDGLESDTATAMEYFEKSVATGVEPFMEFRLARRMLESR